MDSKAGIQSYLPWAVLNVSAPVFLTYKTRMIIPTLCEVLCIAWVHTVLQSFILFQEAQNTEDF
jgi:hypothetical protein